MLDKNKIRNALKEFYRYLLFTFFCVCVTFTAIFHSSCQITSGGIKFIGEDYSSPEIKSVTVISSDEVKICFSKKVSVTNSCVSPLGSGEVPFLNPLDSSINVEPVYEDSSFSVIYKMAQESELGKKYQLYSEVKDETGNSLSFSIPFNGYNSRMPVCVLSEIRDAYQKDKKTEFVEIFTLTAGNLYGLELYCAKDKDSYVFPDIEVNAGEYITVHLRKLNEQCVDELGADLAFSNGIEHSDSGRDLYVGDTKSWLGASCDIVILRNSNNNVILDCVPYCKPSYLEKYKDWNEAELKKYSLAAVDSGVWMDSPDVSGAIVKKDTTSVNYSLGRKNINRLFERVKAGKIEGVISSCKNDWGELFTVSPGAASKDSDYDQDKKKK